MKGNAVLTKIQQPAAVTGLANGTKKDASSLKLPSTVVVETTEGSMKAAVSWNVKEASYKQSSTDAQKFTVSGTVTLPSGVDNDNKVESGDFCGSQRRMPIQLRKLLLQRIIRSQELMYNGVYTTQSKDFFYSSGSWNG
ncbi:MAG: Ig-like domain-containing protein [Eubacterium ramulus]